MKKNSPGQLPGGTVGMNESVNGPVIGIHEVAKRVLQR